MTTATATKPITKTMARAIWKEAQAAATAAAKACVPTPMIVGESKTFFGEGDIDFAKPTYFVAGGMCGYASVRITPARGPMVTFLKAQKIGSPDSYAGGYGIASWQFAPSIRGSQSYEIACAAAGAAAGVFRSYGIGCTVDSRLD